MTHALTPRQQQVTELVARGLTNKEIAQELGIGPEGVKAHVSRLLLRFRVRNRVALVNALRIGAPRDVVLDDAAGSLDAIRRGLATEVTKPGAPDLGQYGRYGDRLGETISALGPYASAEILRRLAALRESMGGIELAVELASALPKRTVDKPLLEAIHSRSATALAAVLELEELLRAQAVPMDARTVEPGRSHPSAKRSSRPRSHPRGGPRG